MPCDSQIPIGMTEAQRMNQIQEAITRLENDLSGGTVTVTVDRMTGAVAFDGWQNRDNVADVCAYRRLATAGSFALRTAVQRAEALAGRQVSATAVAAGTHSHDGGRTWHAGH